MVTVVKTRRRQRAGVSLRGDLCYDSWSLSRLVDGKEPVCPFAGTLVMIVGALVTWAIYTQGQLLL